MSRKFLRKFLPSHVAVANNRHVARFGTLFKHHNLWHMHRRSMAGGVAVGMFAGLVPGSNPVQFAVAALLAVAFRVNLPIAVIVTLYSNPFTIVPLYYLAFKLGQLALFQSGDDIPPFPALPHGLNLGAWMPAALDWLTSIGKPLLIGLPLLALALSVLGYIVVRCGWRFHTVYAWRTRQRRRASAFPS